MIFGFAMLAKLWSNLKIFALKILCFLDFVVLNSMQVFSNLVFGFSFCQLTVMSVFQIFLPNAFYGVSSFVNSSLFSSRNLGPNGYQETKKSLRYM